MRTRSALIATWMLAMTGCFGRSELGDLPRDAGSDVEEGADAGDAGPVETRSSKVDLLFVVDNSSNTDVEHELLAQSVPYMLGRIANPACVNGLGEIASAAPPGAPCATGVREFAPLADVHVAVISTSLGGHGADICSPANPAYDPTQNDASHLLVRGPGNTIVPTYQSLGFLAWDPGQKATPPGESDAQALGAKVGQILRGTGSRGCGYEAQLESIYRFLMDPSPYASLAVQSGSVVATGVDAVLLQERSDFLRPDSLVVVVLISDENDCSTRESGQYYLADQAVANGAPYHLPRARSECAANPASPCCASCGQSAPPGCPPTGSDPACQKGPYTELEDPLNLRCFDQKRRFGVDFLYPVERYVEGFTKPTVVDRQGQTRPNPLFAGGRSPALVLFAGIVGVPWQDIAIDPLALSVGYQAAGFLDWSLLIGDPISGAAAGDPLMVESIAPRQGTNPPTGAALAPPSATEALANPINGHERTIPNQDDLQFACIYPRPKPVDCAAAGCDCALPDIDTNPECQQADGGYGSVSRFGRALPATRELRVLQGIGGQAIVASVCPQHVVDASQPAFAYQPAIDAVLRTMRRHVPPSQ